MKKMSNEIMENAKISIDDTIDLIIQLAKIRKEKNMSQRDLAEKIGVPQSTIGRIELGDTIPRLDTIFKMVNALGLSLPLVKMNSDESTFVSATIPSISFNVNSNENVYQFKSTPNTCHKKNVVSAC